MRMGWRDLYLVGKGRWGGPNTRVELLLVLVGDIQHTALVTTTNPGDGDMKEQLQVPSIVVCPGVCLEVCTSI